MYRKVLLFLIILSACKNANEAKESKQQSQSFQPKEIAQIHLTDLDDKPIDLENYSGKTIFINFWATWCKPCREEMPSIQEAMKRLKDEKIEFFFASDESTEEIQEFKAAHDYNFNYLKVKNLSELNIKGLPTTFIFNLSGELVFSEMGYRKWDDKDNIDLILSKAVQK